jgi:hypothetical protein
MPVHLASHFFACRQSRSQAECEQVRLQALARLQSTSQVLSALQSTVQVPVVSAQPTSQLQSLQV